MTRHEAHIKSTVCAGRTAGELPGCGRRRDAEAGDRSVSHHQLRPERAHDPREHLRRHHALRHHRTGHHRRRRIAQPQDPLRRAPSGCVTRGTRDEINSLLY